MSTSFLISISFSIRRVSITSNVSILGVYGYGLNSIPMRLDLICNPIKRCLGIFTHLKHIHHSFVLDERVVWIEISGFPLNAWSPKAFKKIASICGTPFFVDEDPNETVSIGRICIKTKIHDHINEKCKVIVLGNSHSVSVKEFADWNPDIKDMDMLSSNNSEKDHSVKHEDDLSDNVFVKRRRNSKL
ncbi:RNA-directed DNA polymerase, eukaryota [Tanacetum coccineum]